MENQEKINAKKILEWLTLWKQGDKNAEQNIKNVLLILPKTGEKDDWEIPEIDRHDIFDCVRAIVCGGYPLPDFVLQVYKYDHADSWGDYYNEYGDWGAITYHPQQFTTEDIFEKLRTRPIWRFEERYFSTYYDKETRTLRQNLDKRVLQLNRMADYVNANFETMSMEDFKNHYDEVNRILYDE